ncbi:hypothetical protein ACVOMS_11940 [Bradyrhizobium guangxiense]
MTNIAAQPAGAIAPARASSKGRMLSDRESETNGTSIEACMRSQISRRGSEMFLGFPRIAFRFPRIKIQAAGGCPAHRLL